MSTPETHDGPEKRSVFVDRQGMTYIMGRFGPEHEIKPSVEFDHKGEHICAGLVKVTPRMVMYREYTKVGNAFHPNQS